MMFKHCNSVKAARKAGIPDPEITGPELYEIVKDAMEAYRQETNADRELVLLTYRRQANAENKFLSNAEEIAADPTIKPIYTYEPNEAMADKGCKGLRAVLGLDAAKGLDINMGGGIELVPSTQEMLDDVYDQD